MFQTHAELPPELWAATARAMRAVITAPDPAGDYEILTAAAGFIYTRKTELSIDLFGQPRNHAYGRPGDDTMLSLTVRVPSRAQVSEVFGLDRFARALANEKIDVEIAQTEARLAALRQGRLTD